MSRVQRIRRRRASDARAAHDQARRLSAERFDGPLAPADATWLEGHLEVCDACRTMAAGYEADRLALRAMRERQPEPPRDLWARTSAAIEREAARAGRTSRPVRSARPSRPALGVLSGVAVIAVVIGASILSGGFTIGPSTAIVPLATPPAVAIATSGPSPDATPIVVGAGSVGWVGTSPDGALTYNVTNVDEVCPLDRQPDCAPVSDSDSKRVDISVRPKSISQSPVRNQAVVVGEDPTGGDTVFVIALPTADPTATPNPTTSTPTPAPTPSVEPTTTVAASTSPSDTAVPASPSDTAVPASPIATPAAPSATPSSTPTATVVVTPSPVPTPSSAVVENLAIVTGVKVVGESAAYSPNGAWFAFTARPSDGSNGPDIYVWRVGDRSARMLTHDHVSVFASWVGSRVMGSRPVEEASTAGTDVQPRSFFLDPANGKETAIDAAGWRPVVGPDDRWAVVWDGSIALARDSLTPMPSSGSLVLRRFSRSQGLDTSGPASPIVDGTVTEFDVRWDESGRWLAIWLADATDPSIGRLSLVHLDPVTGRLDRPHGAPQDVTALPGFSIANGRLAWATPPGQGGESSRVQIVAWSNDDVGSVETGPVEDVVVIH